MLKCTRVFGRTFFVSIASTMLKRGPMKREIQVSRKTINSFILLVVVIALTVGGTMILRHDPALLSRIVARLEGATLGPTQPDPQSAPDAQVAVAALTAFYTLDYTEPVDQWQGRVCVLTTPDGCQLIKALFVPVVRKVVEVNKVKTDCTVQALRLVEDKGDTRTWLLEVTLDLPWPGENRTTQVYAEVTRINGTWLLNRILFDQETARFATPALSAIETPTP
jgi:hypothetical protein